MRTSVHIPDELLRRAKQKAAAEGRTLTSLIEEGLRIVLTDKVVPALAERRLPRVSKARGGLAAGLDPVKINAETQEIEDQEMMDRVARQWAGKA